MLIVPEAIIATKFTIPIPRVHFIPRKHLLERLDKNLWQTDGFIRKLTLVSAPAGYGKTTLIADWGSKFQSLEKSPNRLQESGFYWLSLDEGDNDQVRFLLYFIEALRQVDKHIGATALAMLQSPQPPPMEILLGSLVNDMAKLSVLIALVLDDYHLIQNPAIHKMLNFLVEHQPSQMHLVLLTREDPPLPLPRLRVRGQITEIRQDDLRFTIKETAEYIHNIIGMELSEDDLASLDRRTEGWVAGLQLAALSMQGRDDISNFIKAFTGSNRYILDYLIEEVFKQQTPAIQQFLLQTCVLDRLSAPLCDAVTQSTESRRLLQSLEQANLFIVALDEERKWYRFHRLFVELLRHRLRLAEELTASVLHQRASCWYRDHGFQAEAVHHALAAEDWELAAALIEEANDAMLKRGEVVTLLGWFQKFPEGIILASLELCMSYAWVLLLIGQLDKAERLLDHAESLTKDNPSFLGDVFSAQAYLARTRGEPQITIEKSHQALALLPKDNLAARSIVAVNLGLTYWHGGMLNKAEPALREAYQTGHESGNMYVAVTAKVFLGRTHASRGSLTKAADQYREVISGGAPVSMLALAHLDMGTLYHEWNEMAKAREGQRRGFDLTVQSGNVEFQIAAEMLLARLKLSEGALQAAFQAAQRANQKAQDFSPFTQARCASCLAQIALAKGDLEEANRWVEQMPANGDAHSFYMFLNLIKPRLLLAQGKREAAAAELQACYEKASQEGWGYAVIAVRVLQCLAAESVESAYEFLLDALTLAQPEGFIRIFADKGEALIPWLQEVALRGEMVEYVGDILAAMGETARTSLTSELVEPLSEREIEVLRLLVAGLSNREIAGKLVLSLGTVKTHIHNIYGKLGARNRAEAIARTRELELL
jgi:LuxR family maltose regulon positive regulatory protein